MLEQCLRLDGDLPVVMENQADNTREGNQKLPKKIKTQSTGFPGGPVVRNLPASAGNIDSIAGLERSHMLRSNEAHAPQLLNPCATALEAYTRQSLCSTTREGTAIRSPHTTAREQPLLTATRESPCTAMKTQHSQRQINKSL